MSLLDRLVPASALRFDRYRPMTTDDPALLTEWERQFYRDHPVHEPTGFLSLSHMPLLKGLRPDPAAAWGEADRRAEGEQ